MITFQNAMRSAGIVPPANIYADGKLYRFHVEGDKARTENGWYVLHNDPPAGFFGCWKRGISESWSGTAYKALSPEEKARYRANMEAANRKREMAQSRIYAQCRKISAAIWDQANPAAENHPYLKRKKVKAYGLKQYRDSLVVPVRDVNGILHGLQFIAAEKDETGRDKFFKSGTDKTGHYFLIGGQPGVVIYLAEGYATAATVHEATGEPVVVCFDAGNLKPVAENLLKKFKNLTFIICADNDHSTEGNPGLTKGKIAADAVGGKLIYPVFPPGVAGTDFNDLMLKGGAE